MKFGTKKFLMVTGLVFVFVLSNFGTDKVFGADDSIIDWEIDCTNQPSNPNCIFPLASTQESASFGCSGKDFAATVLKGEEFHGFVSINNDSDISTTFVCRNCATGASITKISNSMAELKWTAFASGETRFQIVVSADTVQNGEKVLYGAMCLSVAEPKSAENKFCICKKDKSSCETTQYDQLQECRIDLNTKNSATEDAFECSPLIQVVADINKGCDSLVSATKNGGNSNSNLLGDLKPKIEGLNKLPVKDVQGLVGRIINVLLGILGSLALVMIMYGGVLFMIAGGNADRKKKSIGMMVWAVLGIVIIFSSYAVINFVFDIFR